MGERKGAATAGAEIGHGRSQDHRFAGARFYAQEPQRKAPSPLHRLVVNDRETLRGGSRTQYANRILDHTNNVRDILPEVAPKAGASWVHSNSDKFLHTGLEKILKNKGIQTVIVTGTSACGAVLYTASAAGLLGFSVAISVDGLSASDLYSEQFAVWQLAHGPGFGKRVTITRSDMIKFWGRACATQDW